MTARQKRARLRAICAALFMILSVAVYLYSSHEAEPAAAVLVGNTAEVHFIDCGQGDCSMLRTGENVALIDAGTAKDAEKVIDYLREHGVKRINHLVFSHPHEDHIGGVSAVLDAFEVDRIYLRTPDAGTEPTASYYLRLLKKIKEKKIPVQSLNEGDTVSFGDFQCRVLGPVGKKNDLNNQSLVIRAVYGNISVLFVGDQEKQAEEPLVEKYAGVLPSTVLKVGHHGSSSSSSEAFLRAVAPKYAVISCGTDNKYGHPHREALERLEACGAQIYRTDRSGTIKITTDGEQIKVEKTK